MCVCICVCASVCACTCVFVFLCLHGSLSDRARVIKCIFLNTGYIHDNSELFWDCKLEKQNGSGLQHSRALNKISITFNL